MCGSTRPGQCHLVPELEHLGAGTAQAVQFGAAAQRQHPAAADRQRPGPGPGRIHGDHRAEHKQVRPVRLALTGAWALGAAGRAGAPVSDPLRQSGMRAAAVVLASAQLSILMRGHGAPTCPDRPGGRPGGPAAD